MTLRAIKVPSSDRARCVACGADLAPTQGPREVFVRKSEETKAVLLACQDCRPVLPEAWGPAVIDRLDEKSLKIEPTAPETILSLDIAQQVLSDVPQELDGVVSQPEPSKTMEVPSSVFTVQMTRTQLRLLLGDAADKARCRIKGGGLIIPGDLCLKLGDEVLKEGDEIRGLRVVRDRDLIAKDVPFAYVADAPTVKRSGRLAVVRFKQPQKGVKRSFVKKFFVSENERRFILELLGDKSGG